MSMSTGQCRHRIEVFRVASVASPMPTWQTRHSDPAIRELFGSAILPTPFGIAMAAEEVRALIAEANPDRDVVVRPE